MNTPPRDKAFVKIIAERYDTGQRDGAGNIITKPRYATVGRATKWDEVQIEVELDTMPIGHQGSLKLYFFWDSQNGGGGAIDGYGEPQGGQQQHGGNQRQQGGRPQQQGGQRQQGYNNQQGGQRQQGNQRQGYGSHRN